MTPFFPAIVASWLICLGVYLGSEAERCTSYHIYRESYIIISIPRLEPFNELTQINSLARLTKLHADSRSLSKYRFRVTSNDPKRPA